MMNANYLILGIVMFLTIGCLTDNHKQIIVKDPDGYFTEKYIVKNDSIKDGTYLKFYSTGKLSDSCFYVNGLIQGIRKLYSEKGFLEIIETYKNGEFDGDYIVYYPNGNIKVKQTFKNNKLSGYSYGYFENGNIKEKVKIENEVENGPFEEYYELGGIHWRGTYLNGENEQDTLYEYGLKGELHRKLYCNKGVCYTVWIKGKGFVKQDSNVFLSDYLLNIPVDN